MPLSPTYAVMDTVVLPQPLCWGHTPGSAHLPLASLVCPLPLSSRTLSSRAILVQAIEESRSQKLTSLPVPTRSLIWPLAWRPKFETGISPTKSLLAQEVGMCSETHCLLLYCITISTPILVFLGCLWISPCEKVVPNLDWIWTKANPSISIKWSKSNGIGIKTCLLLSPTHVKRSDRWIFSWLFLKRRENPSILFLTMPCIWEIRLLPLETLGWVEQL